MEEKEYKRAVEIHKIKSELTTRLISLSLVDRVSLIKKNGEIMDLKVIKESGDDDMAKQISSIEKVLLSDIKSALDRCLIRLKVEFETL